MSCTNEQFLFCVIDHSNNGTIDWQAVGDVFGLKKSAAYMRYNRMKAKFGKYKGCSAAGTPSKTPGKQSPKKGMKAEMQGTPTPTSKKRKLVDQDDEGEVLEAKRGIKAKADNEAVKGEADEDGWA
ncbi:hypothetical protein LTR62_000362 [Meristemomyces frigidus]|uniref:Myb-like DNA-binding domain-containing protein n=1 Tax=Meristemomyces frigidus TaxID=1508187 RepID=A0AAN7YID6_9PEZI|nr:hypothetical protein LTR62_000362 [Meristemomyces frigidus]